KTTLAVGKCVELCAIFQRSYLLVLRQTYGSRHGPLALFLSPPFGGMPGCDCLLSLFTVRHCFTSRSWKFPFLRSIHETQVFLLLLEVDCYLDSLLAERSGSRAYDLSSFPSSLSHRGSWLLSLVMAAGAIAPILSSSPSFLD
ncbi:unnamed protein product, partial [Ectocarpus fasciculatus]